MLRIAWLSTTRAPGLDYVLTRQGRDFMLVAGVVTDPDGEALALLRAAGVQALLHNIGAFGRAPALRPAFDARTRDLLAPFEPDVLLLSGYLHIVTAPLLAAYPGRIINVHDADLSVRGADGRPRYRGLHATRDALRAGATETRCTAHLVTADVDEGPILARSRAFPVENRHHYLQRELMMCEGWGPLIVDALARLGSQAAAA
jgi:phosphoribosylglycinamide formyltransferase-1